MKAWAISFGGRPFLWSIRRTRERAIAGYMARLRELNPENKTSWDEHREITGVKPVKVKVEVED